MDGLRSVSRPVYAVLGFLEETNAIFVIRLEFLRRLVSTCQYLCLVKANLLDDLPTNYIRTVTWLFVILDDAWESNPIR